MSDLCRQCDLHETGVDHKGLAGSVTERDAVTGKFGSALCSGCGSTMVDHNGVCVDPNCFRKHGCQPSERL